VSTAVTPLAPPVTPAPASSSKTKVNETLNTRPGDLQYIEVGRIVPSKTNPRKSRSEKEDSDLLQSVRLRGVVQPVILRHHVATAADVQTWEGASHSIGLKASFGPGDKIYEIVAGERRWGASMAAGRKEIPAMVRDMPDDEALEIQIIENLQREDIKPIEEGIGFRQLLAQGRGEASKLMNALSEKPKSYSIEDIAAKVGKSVRYVYARMKLADLIPEIQSSMQEGKITPGHGDLLCRLTPEGQRKALKAPYALFDYQGNARSVRELDSWIKQSIHLSLDAAPWKKSDASLVPKAGACDTCDKNTNVNFHLAPDVKKATCTDPPCYAQKQQAHLVQIETAIKKSGDKVLRVSCDYNAAPSKNNDFVRYGTWKEVKPKACKSATPAVVINGDRAGQQLVVCADQKCTTHHGQTSSTRRTVKKKISPAELKKEQERKRDEDLRGEIQMETLKHIAIKGKPDRWLLNQAALYLIQNVEPEDQGFELGVFLPKYLGWPAPKRGTGYEYKELRTITLKHVPQLKEDKLTGFLSMLLCFSYPQTVQLKDVAAHYKVDMAKVAKEVRAAALKREQERAAKKSIKPTPKAKAKAA
jgi:ParB/RepB/Spo0J family partition protein